MARTKTEPRGEYERLRMTRSVAAVKDAIALYGFRPGERTWWKPWTWAAGEWELIDLYTPMRPREPARDDSST